ncbi:ABC transporter permease [Bosea caraganae]|uniref:ABC transporter permease n=2 Tax=Bosea caraganae TaxID=2763117 RepID=A0A370L495_9HYPH|nr:ABC transporter permease [Bosea caraganae]RDJ28879.1 ABC transporter permease [Bosea caraganae]
MLGQSDIARRYKRSRLGQIWMTISMASMIFGMGLVYSTIFKQELGSYLPFLATGIVLWGFIAGCINEGAMAFIESDSIIRQTDLSKFTYILRVLTRNVLTFAHNFVIIPMVLLICGSPISWTILLFLPGLVLALLNLSWIAYLLAILSARFRDIPQIIQSVVQIAFFITPVMFRPHQLGADHPLLLLNPLAALLSVIRDPLLDIVPTAASYAIALGMAVLGWLLTLNFVRRYSRRIVYWL